jgi:nitrate reductase delta subunit
MIRTYKVLSALLSYPTRELQRADADMWEALDEERLLDADHRGALANLIRAICDADLIDAQERYVNLFDRTRSLSLHMFEHVHGESRDRGQAMVELRERYRAAGFAVAANELPDYLPMLLEFLSLQEHDAARTMLADYAGVIGVLDKRIESRDPDYAAVFDALLSLAKPDTVQSQSGAPSLGEIDQPDDFAALDRAWEEAEVRFGPGDAQQGGCPKASEMLARMGAPRKAAVGA